MRFFIFWVLLIALVILAACDTAIPSPPPIIVGVTAVENTTALADSVAQALTGTAQQHIYATETVLALGGITLTPSSTPTPTPSPRALPTRFSTPTPTPTATITPTPTFAPFLTNTPAAAVGATDGWIRIVHAWAETDAPTLDVYLNGQRTIRVLTPGSQTVYQRITPGVVQVNLEQTAADATATSMPIALSEAVNVPAGGAVSLVLINTVNGPKLITLAEDLAPLATGMSRITLIQADPLLAPVNLILPDIQRTLAANFTAGQVIGPIEIPSNENYQFEIYDVSTGQLIGILNNIRLSNRLNYLVVLKPPPNRRTQVTDYTIFPGTTRLLPTDVNARFINFAFNTGPISISLDGQPQFSDVTPGTISDPVPVANRGVQMAFYNQSGSPISQERLGPWTDDPADKLVLFYDSPVEGANKPVDMAVFSQNAPPSAINANVRLIHGLPNTIALNLEIRPIASGPTQLGAAATPVPWLKIAEAEFGTASTYVRRIPEIVDAQVVLPGTRTVIAQAQGIQLAAAGVYDFVVLPGSEPGSVQLAVIQPSTQLSTAGIGEANPTAIMEAVEATLTAAAPQITATPTRDSTATPTGTPVPTNTPRPSNTPSFPLPAIQVDPAPPNTTLDTVTLFGQNFMPGRRYVVRLDGGLDQISDGLVGDDGTFVTLLHLPANLSPGPHILSVCVACASANPQEQFTVVKIAARSLTPTATAQP